MSSNDSIFVALGEAPGRVAGWVAEVLGVERFPGRPDDADEVGLSGRLSTGDGWFSVVVQRNGHVSPDTEPDDVQAIDSYGIDISIRARGEEALHRESRLLFDKLIESRPDVAMLLLHNLQFLVAAYLPGAGTHDFAPRTTPDADDLADWKPWAL
jgi:hypothetical protein